VTSAESVEAGTLPHEAAGLSARDLRNLYYYLQLTRTLEDRVRSFYLQGKLLGAVYSSRGQEGTAVASAYALGPDDLCAPLIRDLGASMVRGIGPEIIMAQWLGKSGGATGGRDGNLHFGDMSKGVLAPISMLGATIPLCAGVGLAAKQRGQHIVALAYIGDGGTNTGDFHEGLNFAAVLRLPLVLIIENNGYAYSTPVSAHVSIDSFTERAAGYGVPAVSVDGNDVMEVFQATRQAVQRARAGEGPTVIEARTFRMRGHAEHDGASYVPPHLFEEWATRDPIDRLASYVAEHSLLSQADIDSVDAQVREEVDRAVEWAERSPMPDPGTQAGAVYAGSD
jgi:TPP-dependent pyruvate/acetoin dehydrogenase alpha subunit